MTIGLLFAGWTLLIWWMGHMDGVSTQRRRQREREYRALSGQDKTEIWPLIAEPLLAAFKERGGENYLEVRLENKANPSFGPFSLMMQRANGKTPAEVNCELKAENARLRVELEATHADPR
jgi:hypothetical protein